MKIIILIFLFCSTRATFFEQRHSKNQRYQSILYEERSVPSQLACLQLCQFRDGKSVMTYYNGLCQCLKKSDKDEENKETVSDEVAVFEELSKRNVKKREVNFAIGKPSKLSSTRPSSKYGSLIAERGNDGNFSTVAVTNDRDGTDSFQIDLLQEILIKRMVITGTNEPFKNDFYKNLTVKTKRSALRDWVLCKRIDSLPTNPFEFTCDRPTTADRVILQLNSNNLLYVREFEVYTECIIFIDGECIVTAF